MGIQFRVTFTKEGTSTKIHTHAHTHTLTHTDTHTRLLSMLKEMVSWFTILVPRYSALFPAYDAKKWALAFPFFTHDLRFCSTRQSFCVSGTKRKRKKKRNIIRVFVPRSHRQTIFLSFWFQRANAQLSVSWQITHCLIHSNGQIDRGIEGKTKNKNNAAICVCFFGTFEVICPHGNNFVHKKAQPTTTTQKKK